MSVRQNLQTNDKGKRSTEWIGINKIVYSKNRKTNSPSSLIQDGKTIIDQKHCWTFQQFLLEYWQKITKHAVGKKHFSSFVKNPSNLTIFITPTTIEEVNVLISDLKASKSIGPSSPPTKIMKQMTS